MITGEADDLRNGADTLNGQSRRFIAFDWLIPLGLLLGLSAVLRNTDLDLEVQRLFFQPPQGWVYRQRDLWRFLYHFGPTPAVILGWASLAAFIGSFRFRRIAPYRRIALFMALVIMVGPVLLVNGAFKGYWGRPRPRDVEEFGGQEPFLVLWEKGVPGEGKSFPSGHAATGFYLVAPFFVLRRTSKKSAAAFLAVGLSYGLLMGLARMVQGAHYLSDVIWAGGFVYLSGLGGCYLLQLDRYTIVRARRVRTTRVAGMFPCFSRRCAGGASESETFRLRPGF